MNVLEKMIAFISPKWAESRARSRLLARHYEAASFGRRTMDRSRRGTDANNAAGGATLAILRAQGRDLVRNNPWAKRGLRRIVGNTVGYGMRPKATGRGAARVMQLWKRWAETTECDAAGRLTFYGIQAQAMRTIAESGEVLIRRRWRRPIDGLSVPMQLQVLEPDYIDTGKDGIKGVAGGDIIMGVEFDAIGKRVAYWLFDTHPGGRSTSINPSSRRIPADDILHVFEQERPGQIRGPSWFAPVDLRLSDFDEYEGATLSKQKVAACMAAFVTDLDGSGSALGQPGVDSASGQPIDMIEPGMIIPLPIGKQVTFSNPPTSSDHQSFSATALRGVAAGLGTTYEDLTGDYSQVNYSSARMSRLAHQTDIDAWRWNMLIPQLCAPAWNWMLDAMLLAGENVEKAPAEWSPAPMPILDPGKEADAYQAMVRSGFMTWAQAVRELGYDPRDQLREIVEFNKAFDKAEVVLDCDPRLTNNSGQKQMAAAAPADDAADDGSVDVNVDDETTDEPVDGEAGDQPASGTEH